MASRSDRGKIGETRKGVTHVRRVEKESSSKTKKGGGKNKKNLEHRREFESFNLLGFRIGRPVTMRGEVEWEEGGGELRIESHRGGEADRKLGRRFEVRSSRSAEGVVNGGVTLGVHYFFGRTGL